MTVTACPAWCTQAHRPGDLEATHVDVRQMADGDTWVALTMDVLDGRLRIHVSNHQTGQGTESLIVTPDQAPQVAALLARLGHQDIAAAVAELAGLAGGAR